MLVNIIHSSQVFAKIVLPQLSTDWHSLLVCFCIQYRNIHQDQFPDLSDCVLCSLPLFLMVTDSSRKPPLTPFEATSCRETREGVHSLKKEWTGNNERDKNWSNLTQPERFWVTYNDWVGGGLLGQQRFHGNAWSEIQGGVCSVCVRGTWKYRMIRTGQIDGLMAFKWQGRLISVPVCTQTMQWQK